MLILTATSRTQGRRHSDFCHTIEGEPLFRHFVCGLGEDDIDGDCGCSRSLSGTESGRATTTIRVVEAEMTEAEYLGTIEAALRRGGASGTDLAQSSAAMVAELREVAEHFGAGVVLELRGEEWERRAE